MPSNNPLPGGQFAAPIEHARGYSLKRIALWIVIFLMILGGLLYCFLPSSKGSSIARYTPSQDSTQEALVKVLESWKAGLPAGEIPNTKPLIHLTDQGRKPGQLLEDYKILGETRSTAAGRTMVVQLSLTNPAETTKVQFVIVGIDPLWVFRQEDYELLMHWDHRMPGNAIENETPENLKSEGNSPGNIFRSKPGL